MTVLALSDYRRLIVKVGSSLLVDSDGNLNRDWLDTLVQDIAVLQRDGHEILIVSSGSIAIGSNVLGINKARARLEDLQAAAAAGQVQLVHAYQEVLGQRAITAAQVLLTPEDTENRKRFLNARGTLERLVDRAVIPIINENDTVAIDDIRRVAIPVLRHRVSTNFQAQAEGMDTDAIVAKLLDDVQPPEPDKLAPAS